MDYDRNEGIRGALRTTVLVVVTIAAVFLLGTLAVGNLYNGNKYITGITLDIVKILIANMAPLFLMIPFSLIYNSFRPGTKERLYLRLLSCCILLIAVILMTQPLVIDSLEITTWLDDAVQIDFVSAVIDISMLRFVVLIIPVLEVADTIWEFKTNSETEITSKKIF